MVDYSKWDKLEVSDDSDVEVHPNVDKDSFIRWKQRDIHEKRAQREAQIKGLEIQREMYTQLNKRVDDVLANVPLSELGDDAKRNKWLADHYDPKEKCTLDPAAAADSDSPTYNEMVEDLFTQVEGDIKKEGGDPADGAFILKKVQEHRKKTDAVLTQIGPKLKELDQEKHAHITSADYHTGFDSSFVNSEKKKKNADEKKKKAEATASKTASKTASTASSTTASSSSKAVTSSTSSPAIETINSPGSQTPSKPLASLGELELLDETKEFAQIPSEDLGKSCAFVKSHLYIACEQQKDALMMKAFDYQLDGDGSKAKQTVHQALVLQYLDDLFKGARANDPRSEDQLIDLFEARMGQPSAPAHGVFEDDFRRTYEHIAQRCEVIKQEHEAEVAAGGSAAGDEAEGVEQIQLRSMDPDMELIVDVPAKGTPEYATYETIPDDMKKALQTSSLDEVNKVFAKMSVDDAEKLLDVFGSCGVIKVQALLENEQQFDDLKQAYADEDTEGGQAATEVNATAAAIDAANKGKFNKPPPKGEAGSSAPAGSTGSTVESGVGSSSFTPSVKPSVTADEVD